MEPAWYAEVQRPQFIFLLGTRENAPVAIPSGKNVPGNTTVSHANKLSPFFLDKK
jgi:hypothetical protein